MRVPTLHTSRLSLRAYAEADRSSFIATYTDPEVMRAVDGALDEATAGALFDGILSGKRVRVFAGWCATHGGETVGHGALLREGDDLAIGYILPRRHWGRGYATEIAVALVSYARDTLGRARVIATTDVDHIASRRVLEKAGLAWVRDVLDEEAPYSLYETSAS